VICLKIVLTSYMYSYFMHILFSYLMFIISYTLSYVHFKVPQRMIECGLATDEVSANKRASQLIQAAVDRAKSAITKYNAHNNRRDGRAHKKIAGCVPPLSECYFANKVSPDLDILISEYTIILTTLLDCKVGILLAEITNRKQLPFYIRYHTLYNKRKQKTNKFAYHLYGYLLQYMMINQLNFDQMRY